MEAKRGGDHTGHGQAAAEPSRRCAHGTCSVEFMPYLDIYNGEGEPRKGGDLRAEASNSLLPTPWMLPLQSRACTQSRGEDLTTNLFIYCSKHRNVIYSPSLRLAYVKTGKAASVAFFTYFQKSFTDAIVVDTADPDWVEKMPEKVFFFTFVREPVSKHLASYAEVDAVHYPKEKHTSTFSNTTFPLVPRDRHGGTTRYLKFLHDLVLGRFGYKPDDVADDSSIRHASSQLASTCTHGLHFIGHLENIEADWANIQELADVPLENRSIAIPKVHDGETQRNRYYAQDEAVEPSDAVLLRLCRVYRADFDCLGYPLPEVCARRRQEGEKLDDMIDNAFRFNLLRTEDKRQHAPAAAAANEEPVEDVEPAEITPH